MASMLSEVDATIKTTCFGKRYEWFLVSFGGLLINANHLASTTRSQHLKVLLANLEVAPVVFRIWVFQPRRVRWVLRNHNVG